MQTTERIRNNLILSLCAMCDVRLEGCHECPILDAINSAFDEVDELIQEGNRG